MITILSKILKWAFDWSDDYNSGNMDNAPEPVKYRMYKVEPHYYDSQYYVIKYSNNSGLSWRTITKAMDYNTRPPERTFPYLDSEEVLLTVARKFKDDPTKFDEFYAKQDAIYERMLNEWNKKQEAYKNRKTHII